MAASFPIAGLEIRTLGLALRRGTFPAPDGAGSPDRPSDRCRGDRRRGGSVPPCRHRPTCSAGRPATMSFCRSLLQPGMVRDSEREHVDRRIAPALGDRALQHDMAVENTAAGIGDRLVVIVAFDQHGEEAGDAARSRPGLDRRAPGGAAIRRRPTGYSLSMAGGSPAERPISRKAMAKRVTESIMQSTSSALVAEELGERQGHLRRLAAQQRRFIRGRDDDDAAREPSGPSSSSMNSCTSRPRSPIRPITLTSSEV